MIYCGFPLLSMLFRRCLGQETRGFDIADIFLNHTIDGGQGGRTWQAFGGGKHGHETFRQARNYNFRDKCVVFARNLKFSNLTQ